MNANERPNGFLMPELAPPPAGVRPFIARRPTEPTVNPNHVPKPPKLGLVRHLPAEWCYRCDAPAHDDDYSCWVPIRPIPPQQAIAQAALAARAAAGVPLALASWEPEHTDLIVQVAHQLLHAVDTAREAAGKLAARHVWETSDVAE